MYRIVKREHLDCVNKHVEKYSLFKELHCFNIDCFFEFGT
jgi:hypothetical protein